MKAIYRQSLYSQNHAQQNQKTTVVDQQEQNSHYPELCDGCIVVRKGLTTATHLNGETGQLVSHHEDRGRWGVDVIKSGELICVMPSNLMLLADKNTHEMHDRIITSATAGISPRAEPDDVDSDRFKRMAYAFVIQDYYKQPKNQRSIPSEMQLSRMVESRYENILEEFSQHGWVNSTGYEYFDAPDSPVPIFGSELAEIEELPLILADVNPQAGPRSMQATSVSMHPSLSPRSCPAFIFRVC